MADEPEVIIRVEGGVGRLTLNRPDALHALTLDMCRKMTAALLAWQDDPAVRLVMLDHSSGRGFCAGGDVRFLYDSIQAGDGGAISFFHDEYQLDHLLFAYPKPTVAFMDGMVMGGGSGIAMPCRYRLATERTAFAMPETGIGLFPDVGGGWFLSRLPGRLGQYLALTGARIDGSECVWAGLATHYLPTDQLAEAKARIVAGHEIAGALTALSVTPPEAKIAAHAGEIAKHFASDRYEDILASLEADPSEWAAKTLATLRTKSPQTCKVALRQLADSARLSDFAENMAMEYRIAARVLTRPDFAEGVRAVIVDKTNDPKWDPATPEGVTDELIESIFAPLPADKEWKPL
jgi:enoyl-CoA hydratase